MTDGGSTSSDSLLHPSNAYAPILLTQSPMRNSFNEEQCLKALSSIIVTESGIVIYSKLAHSLNVLGFIWVRPRDIYIYVKFEQF